MLSLDYSATELLDSRNENSTLMCISYKLPWKVNGGTYEFETFHQNWQRIQRVVR